MVKSFEGKNRGITLVALVITIIILLILAGISIATLTGSGLFEKARLAEQESKNAQEKEDATLGDYENKIEEYIDSSRDTVIIDKEEYENLKKKGTIELIASSTSKTTETQNVSSMSQYNKFYVITINSNGNILATSIIPGEVFRRGSLIYSAYTNDGVYAGFATYKNDTSVEMYCLNVGEVELYGEY